MTSFPTHPVPVQPTSSRLDDNLTLALLIRDTPGYITRWLTWASLNDVRFPILIADGSCDDACEKIVSGFKCGGLNLNYQRHEPDTSRPVFYRKITSALNSVSTPYVTVLADDDLPYFQGIRSALRELIDSPSFVSARGRIHDFECQPDPSQLWADSVFWKWYEMDENLSNPDASQRLIQHLKEYCLTYHDIINTPIAQEIFQGQLDLGIFDPNIGELFLSTLLVVKGPILRMNTPFLFRASRPNSVSATWSKNIDPFDELFQDGWLDQYKKMIGRLSSEMMRDYAPEAEGTLRKFIHLAFRHFYAPSIIGALRPNINQTRVHVAYSGSVRPYPPLPAPPDELHASVAKQLTAFLQSLKAE